MPPVPPSPAGRLVRVLAGERLDPPPVWFMRQAGRYLPEYRMVRAKVRDFLELCYTPDLAAEVTLQPLRRYRLDAAILFSDILVVPHALGVAVRFVEGEGPRVEALAPGRPLPAFEPDAFDRHLAPVYETVERVRAALPGDVALIGFAGAPWTLAAYLLEGAASRDFARARTLAFAAPGFVRELVELLTAAVTRFLARQIEHGANVVKLFDSWAGVLPEPLARELVIEPARCIAAELSRRFPRVPLIGFPRGLGALYPAYVAVVRPAGVALDTTVPLAFARERLAGARGPALQGNLDPAALVAGGEALDREVVRIVEALRGVPHVFNLGHGILPATPPEHVERALRVLQSTAADAK